MFIISIDGGLGNQMFEYAFFLSMKNCFQDSKVYLDNSMMKKTVHNGYELADVFGIDAPMAVLQDVIKYSEYCPEYAPKSKLINSLNKFRRCILGVKSSYIVQEDSSSFYKEYFHLNPLHSYYLRGVWANVRYFESIKEKLMDAFTFPELGDDTNIQLEAAIRDSNSIGIHFRRGDYVEFGFEILNKEYYVRAMQYMKERVEAPIFFVFSDDIESAKQVIGEEKNIVYVEGNKAADSYIDMKLMSLCKHNIIANSTFSFWGAYLNKNSEKIVIYPKKPLKGCNYPYADYDWIGL